MAEADVNAVCLDRFDEVSGKISLMGGTARRRILYVLEEDASFRSSKGVPKMIWDLREHIGVDKRPLASSVRQCFDGSSNITGEERFYETQ
jgi:hypothetical protein